MFEKKNEKMVQQKKYVVFEIFGTTGNKLRKNKDNANFIIELIIKNLNPSQLVDNPSDAIPKLLRKDFNIEQYRNKDVGLYPVVVELYMTQKTLAELNSFKPTMLTCKDKKIPIDQSNLSKIFYNADKNIFHVKNCKLIYDFEHPCAKAEQTENQKNLGVKK